MSNPYAVFISARPHKKVTVFEICILFSRVASIRRHYGSVFPQWPWQRRDSMPLQVNRNSTNSYFRAGGEVGDK